LRHNKNNMHSTKAFTILIIFVILYYPAHSYEVLTTWKLAKQSEDIQISYRSVEIGDTLITRQMRITFLIEAAPEEIIELFRDADKLSAWSPEIKKCEILQDDHHRWVTYSLFDIPWPLNQKDQITEYQMVKSDSAVKLFLTGKPDLLPHYPNISRMNNMGLWVFKPLGHKETHVEFYVIYLSNPVVPRFIKDPIIQNSFVDSINKLKILLTKQV